MRHEVEKSNFHRKVHHRATPAPLATERAETTNTLSDPAYRANNDPPGCSISLVIQGRGATERGHFVVDFGAVQVASVLSYRGTTSHAGAYQEARIAAWTWHDHAETTYAITVDRTREFVTVLTANPAT